MYPLKQSTAITIPVFAHDENGDAVTGLVDAGFTKRISKNGAAFGAMTVTITEMENGWYSLPLGTGHTDTLGALTITLTHASCKQINLQFRVHARLPDDLAYPTVSGRSLDVTANGNAGIDWNNIENPTTVVDLSGTDINLVDTASALTGHTPQTGDSFAIVNNGSYGNAQLVRSTTPANTLDVTATGAAGIDWGNVENQGTSVDLSATSTNLVDTASVLTGHTPQTGDSYSEVTHASYGLDQLVRSTTPANTLDVAVGGQAGVNLDNSVGTLAKTTDITGFNDVSTAQVQSSCDAAITANTDINNIDTGVDAIEAKLPSKTYLMGSADADGGFDAEAKADVNAEVVDVIKADTIAEMAQGIPPTTPTFEEAIMYLYMALRNIVDVDSGFKEFYNDVGTVIWKKALADDGSNYTEAKGESGP